MATDTQRHVRQEPAHEDLYPKCCGAENAEVVIHPTDWKYGALLVGGQGTGKDLGDADLLRERAHRRECGTDRHRSQVGAVPNLPADDPARLRQARVVLGTSATRRSGWDCSGCG